MGLSHEDDGVLVKGGSCLDTMKFTCRLQRLRSHDYYVCATRSCRSSADGETRARTCVIDPGVRAFVTLYDPSRGFAISVADPSSPQFRTCTSIDDTTISYRDRCRLRRIRCPLARRLLQTRLCEERMRVDLHQKLASWIAARYDRVLLSEFNTSDMGSRHHSWLHRTMTHAHASFRRLLEEELARVGGKLIACTELLTSKTCTRCGNLHLSLGVESVYRCQRCNLVLDRDVNAARNIFLLNEH